MEIFFNFTLRFMRLGSKFNTLNKLQKVLLSKSTLPFIKIDSKFDYCF